MCKDLLISLLVFVVCNATAQPSVSDYVKSGGNASYDYKTREMFNSKALSHLRLRNDSKSRKLLIKVCWNYYYMNDFDRLKEAAKLGIKKSVEKKDSISIGRAIRMLGMYYENISANDSAYYFYTKAGKIFKKLNNYEELCDNYRDKALIQYYANDFLGSDLALIKALKYAEQINSQLNIYAIYGSMALNSSEMNDYYKALQYYDKATLFFYENKLYEKGWTVSGFLISKAMIYFDLKLYDRSLKVLNFALKANTQKNQLVYCNILDNIARIHLIRKNFLAAKHKLIVSSNIRDSLNINLQKNYNRLYLSEYYAATNDTLKSRQYAHQAFELSKEFRAPKDMLLCLKQLSKIDAKNALKYSQDYIRISDSMQLLERQNRNKFAKIAYETEEIATEKNQAVSQKWMFFGIAILIFTTGVLIFIVIRQRIRQKELKFNQELQKNDTEIYQLIQAQQDKIDEGREIEKTRIAQNLSDGIMNRLAATRVNLQVLDEDSDAQTIQYCIPLIKSIQNIEKEIREVSHLLTEDDFVSDDSYLSILESLFNDQEFEFKSKCHFEIDKNINWEEIKGSTKVHIYRILQEALSNVMKHAKATTVIASILKHDDALLIEIYDDGIGFSLNGTKKGIGLQSIYSRAKLSNGTVEIKSHKDIGTTLIVTIPKQQQTNIQQNGYTDKYSYC